MIAVETLADELHKFISNEDFGKLWTRELSLTARADLLYWIVYLAERGLEERRQAYRTGKNIGSAEKVASLCVWKDDLVKFINKIKAALPTKPKK